MCDRSGAGRPERFALLTRTDTAPEADPGVGDPAPSTTTSLRSWAWWLPVLGPAFLALVLRVWRISEQSLRIDESWSSWVAGQGPVESVRIVSRVDTHPPLSYVLQSVWRVFGDSNAAIRSLSTLMSVLVVAMVVILARRVAGTRVGVTAGLLIAVSPWQIQQANDARMYTIATLCLAIALLGAIVVLDPRSAHERTVGLVAYGTAALAGLYTLNVFAVSLAVIAAVVLVLLALDRSWPLLRAWLGVNVLVLVGYGLWLPSLFGQINRLDRALRWTDGPSGEEIHAMLRAPWLWVYGGTPSWLGVWLDVLVLGLVVFGAVRLRRAGWLLAAVFVVWPVVALLVSTQQNVLIDRVLVPSSIAAYPLVAAGAWSLAQWSPGGRPVGRWVGAAAVAALLLLAIPGLVSYAQDYRLTEFERAADVVASGSTDGTTVVYVANFGQIAIDHYADLPGDEVGLPADFFADPAGDNVVTPESLDRLDEVIETSSDVWLVRLATGSTDPDGLAYARLDEHLEPTRCVTVRGIVLVHFTPDGTRDPTCPV